MKARLKTKVMKLSAPSTVGAGKSSSFPFRGGSNRPSKFPRADSIEERRRHQAVNRMAQRGQSGSASVFPRADEVEEQRRQRTLNSLSKSARGRAASGGSFPRADDITRENTLGQLARAGARRGGSEQQAPAQKGFHSFEEMLKLDTAQGGNARTDFGEAGRDLFTRAVSIDEKPYFGTLDSYEPYDDSDDGHDLVSWDDVSLEPPKGSNPSNNDLLHF